MRTEAELVQDSATNSRRLQGRLRWVRRFVRFFFLFFFPLTERENRFCCGRVSNARNVGCVSDLCQDVKCKFGSRCVAGDCVCPINCSYSESSELVCASNMVTYLNECEMEKASCEQPDHLPPLSVFFYGSCKEKYSLPLSKSFLFFN